MAARLLTAGLIATLALGLLTPAQAARPATRRSTVEVRAPAQFNMTLAAVRFHDASGRPSRVVPGAGPGLYFVAGALVRHPAAGGPRALVLAVNRRPRGSEAPDRVAVSLRVTAARRLGRPSIRELVDAFPAGAAIPSWCPPAAQRHALAAGDLRAISSVGGPLPGFSAAAAVAQAFDVVCGLTYDPAFAQAVTGCATRLAAGCCPANALCAAPVPAPAPTPAPTPAPAPVPVPVPPSCPPCQRPPCVTTICPLALRLAERVIVCPLSIACAAR